MAFSLGPIQWPSKRLRALSPSLPCTNSLCSSHFSWGGILIASTLGVLASASLFEMWHNAHAMTMHEWRSQPHFNQVRKINHLNDSSWQWNDSNWVEICPHPLRLCKQDICVSSITKCFAFLEVATVSWWVITWVWRNPIRSKSFSTLQRGSCWTFYGESLNFKNQISRWVVLSTLQKSMWKVS